MTLSISDEKGKNYRTRIGDSGTQANHLRWGDFAPPHFQNLKCGDQELGARDRSGAIWLRWWAASAGGWRWAAGGRFHPDLFSPCFFAG